PPQAKVGVAAFTLGRCYSEQNQFAKAIPAYEKAIASKDAQVVSLSQLSLAEAAMQTQQWEKASTALDAVVKGTVKPEQAPIIWYWRGQAKYQLGRYPDAEESYQKVVSEYGKSEIADGALFGAGLAALKQNKNDVARQRLKSLVDRYPDSPDRAQAMLTVANLDLDAKRYPEARDGFNRLLGEVANGNKNDKALERAAEEGLVRALLELQDYAGAATRLQSLLEKLPQDDAQRPRAQLALGNCQYRQKQYQLALLAYKEAAKATDAAVAGEGQYWAGNASLALQQPAEAALLFGELPQRFPKHALAPRAQLKCADALVAAKKPDQATTAYQKVIQQYPDAPEAAEARKAMVELADSLSDPAQLQSVLKLLPAAERGRGTLRLARIQLRAKQYAPAEGTLNGLLKEQPDAKTGAEASYLLGLIYDAQGKSEPAAKAFSAALEGNDGATWAADAQGRLAWLYLETKQPAKAEAAASAVLAGKPSEEAGRQARLALLQSEVDQQKWAQALEQCRSLSATKLPGETAATVLFTQAWVSEKVQKPEEVLPLWEKLLSEHRKSDYAPEAMIRLGDARFKAEKFAEARELYSALAAEFPKSPLAPEARYKNGSALFNLGQHAPAAAEWDRLAADPNAGDWGPEALYWAGVAYDKLGKKAEAVQRLERLVQNHPKHPRVPTAKVRLAALKAVLSK
ncbi:MAG TPA: tetratricopeptide repeat protein, partial [Armatimonadota bacterium]|nr:tetratricopeptide repeat protein [Armatimonadota bacterium]